MTVNRNHRYVKPALFWLRIPTLSAVNFLLSVFDSDLFWVSVCWHYPGASHVDDLVLVQNSSTLCDEDVSVLILWEEHDGRGTLLVHDIVQCHR